MGEALAAHIAPIMFAALVVFLLVGYPIAFSLSAIGLLFGFIGIQLGLLAPELLQALPERVFGIMRNETLLAIPFFTFMGFIFDRSGMAEELLETIGQLFGTVRGGLAYAVIFVGAVLGGPAGVVAATVISMGLISLPVMLRYSFDKRLACGVIAASGTLAQIIPPSIVLVVLADQMGKSVGDMYIGAWIPSFVLVGLYFGYVFLVTRVKPEAAPALPPQARALSGKALAWRVVTAMIPQLILLFLVLGTILLGIATPTEGGAMGAAGVLALALLRRKLSWKLLKQAMDSTAKLTSFVVFVLIGATIFSLTFRGVDGDLWVEQLFAHLPGGQAGFLIVVNLLVFALAFFLDFFEIAFILIPLLAPVAQKLGIDLIWFGVMLAVNIQTSFMHPPFGFALFYLRSVAPPEIKTTDLYWGAIPFVAIQLITVALVIAFPQIVMVYKWGEAQPEQSEIELQIPAPEAAEQEDPSRAIERLLKEQAENETRKP
jgi:tripartite ATP-independent transporter DctM subunit